MGRKRTKPGSQRASLRYDPLWMALLAAGAILLATVAAFGNSFHGPFVFDDTSITDNPTIRHLWPIWETLCPPNNGETVSGRPLLNLSFAVNYAVSGCQVWSYHATNLTIHLLGALLLFGILRRTFLLPALRHSFGGAANPLAMTIAILWAIHPLQTESVTYVVQRAESLVALFYLLTLYGFIRGADSARAIYWYVGSVLACLLGMASKELMVSAPLIVLLYDRTFLAGSFRAAWRQRYGLYLALGGTWLLLGWLVLSANNRGNTAGFGLEISWWAYLCTQFGAIVHYLRLCVWPHPLVFDYGTVLAHGAMEIVPYAVAVGLLGVATIAALWRWPKAGFLGAWFFAILAPTSSVVPVVTQTVAEHRMYLPLAAVVTGVVVSVYLAGRWLWRHEMVPLRALQVAGGSLALLVSLAVGILTFHRNADYRSELSIWRDTVDKASSNERARNHLGMALVNCGQIDEAIAHYRKALEIQPDNTEAHNNLGVALANCGQLDEAITHFRRLLEIKPDSAKTHNNLGAALANCGQFDEAIAHYQKALEIKPDSAETHYNLGVALTNCGQVGEAIVHYRKALELKPDYADAHKNLGAALVSQGQVDEAIAHYWESLRANPDDVETYNNLAWELATCSKASIRNGAKAVELAERAVRLSDSRDPMVLDTLAAAYAEAGRFPEAVKAARKAQALASRQNKPALAKFIEARIPLYEAKTPFRQSVRSSPSPAGQP